MEKKYKNYLKEVDAIKTAYEFMGILNICGTNPGL